MQKRIPLSFTMFMIAIGILIAVLILAFFFSANPKYRYVAMFLAVPPIIAFSFLSVGIYAGINYQRSDDRRINRLNRVGFVGSIILYVLILSYMTAIPFVSYYQSQQDY